MSGLSGAGKSSAVKILEDLEFYCVDNLPVRLLHPFLDLSTQSAEGIAKLALVIDARDTKNIGRLPEVLKTVTSDSRTLELVFLEASDDVLARRFSETRHRHPLAKSGSPLDGIREERELLAPLRKQADHVIDTSTLTTKDLRRQLLRIFGSAKDKPTLSVQIGSFGFKYGLPAQADMVLDVRFLPNPFFREELKAKPGTDSKVIDFVMQQKDTHELLTEYERLLKFLLPRFDREGKSFLHIAIGCTGGRHRSVVIAEELAKVIEGMGHSTSVVHRDLERDPALLG